MQNQQCRHKVTFLDPRFKLDYVKGVNRQILEDSILNEGMQLVTSTQQLFRHLKKVNKACQFIKEKASNIPKEIF